MFLKDKKIYYIYFILNKINNKIYVGKTINPEKRFKRHCYSKQFIGLAIKKYKSQNFEYFLIADTLDENECNDIEKFYIKHWKTTKKQYGYNIASGGEGGNLLEGLSEQKKKKRNEKIRKANLGKKASNETKKKQSKAHKGQNNSMFGKKHTIESIKKNSESQLNEKHWRFISFNQSEKNFIFENLKLNISINEISRRINFKFNKNFSSKVISRFLKRGLYDS
jgi:group I intron endonuclease